MTHTGMSSLVGLDINANRARAVTGPAGYAPTTLALDGAHAELPLALSLEKRTAEVGRAGLALCRRLPHLACLHFLAQVGEPKQWKVGRHKLDAAKAMTQVFERIRPYLAGTQGLVLSVPAYLSRTQVALLATLAEKVRLPLLGTLPSPLALALAGYAQNRWSGLALVADVDDQGLTWSAVLGADERARVLSTHTFPHLSLRAWKERLLNLAADRCVRQSRRDPRESGAAEQMLYEELDNVLEAGRQGRMAELVVQADHWCQNLFFRPEELTGCCNPLLRAALETVNICLAGAEMHGPPSTVLVSAAASRLPGLVQALDERLCGSITLPDESESTDFGDDLLAHDGVSISGSVQILNADAAARAAHGLALGFAQGDWPRRSHLELAPLPAPQPALAGPPRLQFHGQDYLLRSQAFTLGKQAGCNLVLDAGRYPSVASRHCEIVPDRRGYVLRDRSRTGTLVNDRPVAGQITLQAGDWIRLGPDGPVLRFLGGVSDGRRAITTA